MENNGKRICDYLKENSIRFNFYEHQPVYTVEDVKNAKLDIPGIPTKNLFLRDKKKTKYFVLISEEDKKINLKKVGQYIDTKNLTFASEQELNDIIGLQMGDVGPFGIINDNEKKVSILLDSQLIDKSDINLSANSLTTTITIDYGELVKFIESVGNNYTIIDNNNGYCE